MQSTLDRAFGSARITLDTIMLIEVVVRVQGVVKPLDRMMPQPNRSKPQHAISAANMPTRKIGQPAEHRLIGLSDASDTSLRPQWPPYEVISTL